MTKNRLGDLNDHLFAALERLNDDDLTPEQIAAEVRRADGIVAIADQITENARTRLAGAKLYAEYGEKVLGYLPQIGGGTASQVEAKAEQ